MLLKEGTDSGDLFYVDNHCANGVRSINIPIANETKKRNSAIYILCFLGLLVLKRTAMATPLFISKPDIIAPAER